MRVCTCACRHRLRSSALTTTSTTVFRWIRAPSRDAISRTAIAQDNVFVTVVISVQYEAMMEKAYEAYYKLSSPEVQIQSYVYDTVRSTLPKNSLEEAYAAKDTNAQAVKEALDHQMVEYGYKILQTLVTDMAPELRVKNSFNEINASRRIREALQEKAEGDKILQVKAAEADAESKYLSGVGVARQRAAIIDGLRDSISDFSSQARRRRCRRRRRYGRNGARRGARGTVSLAPFPPRRGSVVDMASRVQGTRRPLQPLGSAEESPSVRARCPAGGLVSCVADRGHDAQGRDGPAAADAVLRHAQGRRPARRGQDALPLAFARLGHRAPGQAPLRHHEEHDGRTPRRRRRRHVPLGDASGRRSSPR